MHLWLISYMYFSGKRRHTDKWISVVKTLNCEESVWNAYWIYLKHKPGRNVTYTIPDHRLRNTHEARQAHWDGHALNWSGHWKHPSRDYIAFKLIKTDHCLFLLQCFLSNLHCQHCHMFYCKMDVGKGISRNKAWFSRHCLPQLSLKQDIAL